jgi:serine/threonine protein kinase
MMTPERWRQVTRVYGAVMTKPPEVRAAALRELCPDDEVLRKEVESLLADDSGAALLDQPLADVASSLVDQNLSGRTLGPYRLDAAIGAGGMGQVYRASDTRLHRTVAIKKHGHRRFAAESRYETSDSVDSGRSRSRRRTFLPRREVVCVLHQSIRAARSVGAIAHDKKAHLDFQRWWQGAAVEPRREGTVLRLLKPESDVRGH